MSNTETYYIPSSYSRIAARVLGLQERELPRLLHGTGLSAAILYPGDETRITGQQQLQVLINAHRLSGRADFGLLMGQQLQPSSHGPLGYLALSSPDLLSSLESLRDFLPVRIPFVQLELGLDEHWISCVLRIRLQADAAERRILHECFAMVIQALVEAVLGREVREGQVDLDHSAPVYRSAYPRYLHSSVRFEAGETVYRLPRHLAREANTSEDAESYRAAQALCLTLLEEVPRDDLSCVDQVRRYLLLQTPGTLTESDVARAMFVSKRTLARRLEREGSSYRAVREQLFAELAARHLRDSQITVEAVATLLGYGDSAAFRKAFRRWYGQSPSAFRRGGRPGL